MAFSHLQYNKTLEHGRLLGSALQQLEQGSELLADTIAVMVTMIDGDGSSSTHFPEVTTRFGFSSDANSKAAYDELVSLNSKFSGNASVSNVNAAMLQAFGKFR